MQVCRRRSTAYLDPRRLRRKTSHCDRLHSPLIGDETFSASESTFMPRWGPSGIGLLRCHGRTTGARTEQARPISGSGQKAKYSVWTAKRCPNKNEFVAIAAVLGNNFGFRVAGTITPSERGRARRATLAGFRYGARTSAISSNAALAHSQTAVRLVRNGCEIARRQLSGKKVE